MKIVYRESFLLRLEKQLSYIARHSPTIAKKLKKELINKIKEIPANPKVFRKSIYFEDESIRDLVFKGFTIVFRINGSQIEVFGFVNYQQNPHD